MSEKQPPESTARTAPLTASGAETELLGTPTLTGVVDTLARRLHKTSTSDLGELRRVGPGKPHAAAFWRLITGPLEPLLPPSGRSRAEAEARWAVILSAMAVLAGLHSPGRSLGTAMAVANVHELRVSRLLSARGKTLDHCVRAIAYQLANKAMRFRMTDLAWLVLTEGNQDEQQTRYRIARDYYRACYERSIV